MTSEAGPGQGLNVTHESIALSRDCFLVVVFTNVKSPNYDHAVSVAQGAEHYATTAVGKSVFHIAAFGKSQDQVGRLLALLGLIANWTTVQYFSRGRALITRNERNRADDVAQCYHSALSCNDYKAHCHVVTDRVFKDRRSQAAKMRIDLNQILSDVKESPRYVVPCRLISGYPWIDTDHPSTWENQLQAAAVERGAHVCPYFDVSAFEQVGGDQ